jgi:SAM-dependent methyltransferase
MWEQVFPGGLDQLGQVRAALRPLLSDCPVADDIILLLSELCANACAHSASGRPGGKFTVRLQHFPGEYVWGKSKTREAPGTATCAIPQKTPLACSSSCRSLLNAERNSASAGTGLSGSAKNTAPIRATPRGGRELSPPAGFSSYQAWQHGRNDPVISNGWPRRPNVSRIYDWLLCGKDNYDDDRRLAGQLLALIPDARAAALANENFLARAVRFAVKDAGIRQVIDIGTGLPAMCNTGQVAREIEPDTRVVYVDSHPVVVSHARALLCGDPGVCAIEGDLRDPACILGHPGLRAVVDLREPIVILLTAVLHFVPDEDRPHRLVNALKAAMAPGSHLVISHATTRRPQPLCRRAGP